MATEEQICSKGNFRFSFMGHDLSCESVVPGAMRMHTEAVSDANQNVQTYTGNQATFEDWTFTRNVKIGDTRVKDEFDAFAKGQKTFNLTHTAVLEYQDRQKVTRRAIEAQGVVPIMYDSCDLNSRDAGCVMKETVTFKVYKVNLLGPGT